MKIIICRACGDIFYSRKHLLLHIMKLECFNENLEWRVSREKLNEMLKEHDALHVEGEIDGRI